MALLLLLASSVAATTPSAHVLGPVEVVYDWERDHCDDGVEPWQWDVPDAPARMYRRANETVLIASVNLGSRANRGIDANHLKHTCEVYHNTTCGNQQFGPNCEGATAVCCDPSLWSDREWIYSPVYFPENDTLVALTHMEFHNQNLTRETSCSAIKTGSGACWFNAITSHRSSDGGRSWFHLRPAPHHLVAAQPYRQPEGGPGPANGKKPMGYEAPSNVVRDAKTGWYFAAIQTWSYKAQTSASEWGKRHGGYNGSGSCIIRTRDVHDPTSWRAWRNTTSTGGAWDVTFVDPYNDDPSTYVPEEHVCTPVLNIGYPSLAWSTVYDKWIVTGSKVWDCSTVIFALSDDLVHWSSPYTLYQPTCRPNGEYREIYPSLMDPASPSPNFDVVGALPYVYFNIFYPSIPSPSGRTTVVRSIARVPLRMGSGERDVSRTDRSNMDMNSPRGILVPRKTQIVHCAGQDAKSFNAYSAFMRSTVNNDTSSPPAVAMSYLVLERANRSWFVNLRTTLETAGGNASFLIPQIGLRLPSGSALAGVAKDETKAQIEEVVAGLKLLGRPAYVRVGYEFNGEWNNYPARDYRAAWNTIVGAWRGDPQLSHRVAAVWDYSCDAGIARLNWTDWLPRGAGAQIPDWWGVNIFSVNSLASSECVLRFVDAATSASMPVMIGESTPRSYGVLDAPWGKLQPGPNGSTSMCVGVSYASAQDGAPAVLWPCGENSRSISSGDKDHPDNHINEAESDHGADPHPQMKTRDETSSTGMSSGAGETGASGNQKWRLNPDGYLINADGKCLGAANHTTNSSVAVLTECRETAAGPIVMKWAWKPAGGVYRWGGGHGQLISKAVDGRLWCLATTGAKGDGVSIRVISNSTNDSCGDKDDNTIWTLNPTSGGGGTASWKEWFDPYFKLLRNPSVQVKVSLIVPIDETSTPALCSLLSLPQASCLCTRCRPFATSIGFGLQKAIITPPIGTGGATRDWSLTLPERL